MYVVRIENDEAVMYRAFRRFQSSRVWAAERNAEDVHCLVDILEVPEPDDSHAAVAQAKGGKGQRILQGETLDLQPAAFLAATDIEFGRSAAV